MAVDCDVVRDSRFGAFILLTHARWTAMVKYIDVLDPEMRRSVDAYLGQLYLPCYSGEELAAIGHEFRYYTVWDSWWTYDLAVDGAERALERGAVYGDPDDPCVVAEGQVVFWGREGDYDEMNGWLDIAAELGCDTSYLADPGGGGLTSVRPPKRRRPVLSGASRGHSPDSYST